MQGMHTEVLKEKVTEGQAHPTHASVGDMLYTQTDSSQLSMLSLPPPLQASTPVPLTTHTVQNLRKPIPSFTQHGDI